ncbi:lecithin-cholesterol acyltransferase-like 1 [Primulina tabacum]|uniref:lecithin-cholesterol acyltransferase-like 1 n=1 Tax=Primulina tabacum TaxID=48773 RepID=UPI003F5ABE06
MKGCLLLRLEFILYLSMATVTSAFAAKDNLHPVILIPGSGGNQLEARLTAEYKPSGLFCNRFFPLKKDCDGWFRIWFDPSVLLKPFAKCYNRRMMIYYDPDADDYHNAPGVETRVSDFGSTQSLLYLDPHLKHATSYMEPLVKFLEQAGYASGKNLFGAPYDFRYALAAEGHPSKVGSKFLEDLKNLVESSSHSNGGKPVILVSHSLGGLFVLHFLNRNSNYWRQRYIKHFIALSAPWGGTVDEMVTFASGNTFGVPLVDPLVVREQQRSSANNLWLMPSPKVFNDTKPLVITPNSSYTVLDIPHFLRDIGFPEGVQPYKTRVLPLVENLTAPLVPVTCITGSEVRTPETLLYGDHGFDKGPDIQYGDGDGTVNMVSLLALQRAWTSSKNQVLKVIKLPGVTHTSILNGESSLDVIIGEISSINSHISGSIVSSTVS